MEEKVRRLLEEARGLLAFHREFVGSVKDHLGSELGPDGSYEWQERIDWLQNAVDALNPPQDSSKKGR